MATAAQAARDTRARVWAELRGVARPDSRFHWDFASFIPDFAGSEACADRITALPAWAGLGEKRVFVTPDNSTEDFRRRLLLLRRPFVITTYGIVRGFLALDPADVPPGEERYAATLDGADRYGRPLSLAELKTGGVFGLLVTGSAAVSVTGVRFGKGHGYFDLEWAMLSELGLVDGRTEVVAVVHDCQVVEEPLPAQPHDVVVDRIVTPTRTVDVDHPPRAPGRIRWDALKGGELKDLGVVAELEALLRPDPT